MFRYDPYWKTVDSFRALYDTIVALKPEAVPDYLAEPGLVAARPLMEPLQSYQRLNSPTNPYPVQAEDLWDLYALSRISDHLLLPFQMFDASYTRLPVADWLNTVLPSLDVPTPRESAPSLAAIVQSELANRSKLTIGEVGDYIPHLTCKDYLQFFQALGFERFSATHFSPLCHEVVAAEEADAAGDEVTLVHEFWPGLRWGDMLFARAGVAVRCSSRVMNKAIAERSTLYFAHRRLLRPTTDLSWGWGHNSEWRTKFRRDYQHADEHHFNVDGEVDIGGDSPHWLGGNNPPWSEADDADLPMDARRELLMHRCFVRCTLPGADRWPYDDTLTIRNATPRS